MWMRPLALFVAMVTLAISFPASAHAAQSGSKKGSDPVDATAVLGILQSADPAAGFAALSPAQHKEAARLIEDNLVVSEEVSSIASLTGLEASAAGQQTSTASLATAAATQCWSHYYYATWTLWSLHVANSWMQLNWCGSGGRITSYSVTNVGGAATGLRYDGHSQATRNVDWEVRGLTTHTFSLWLPSVTKCMQIRGGATGLYSRSISCDMS